MSRALRAPVEMGRPQIGPAPSATTAKYVDPLKYAFLCRTSCGRNEGRHRRHAGPHPPTLPGRPLVFVLQRSGILLAARYLRHTLCLGTAWGMTLPARPRRGDRWVVLYCDGGPSTQTTLLVLARAHIPCFLSHTLGEAMHIYQRVQGKHIEEQTTTPGAARPRQPELPRSTPDECE